MKACSAVLHSNVNLQSGKGQARGREGFAHQAVSAVRTQHICQCYKVR